MKARFLPLAGAVVIAAGIATLAAGQVGSQPAGAGLAANAAAAEVTFYADVADTFQLKCERCHRPNAAGPFPLAVPPRAW